MSHSFKIALVLMIASSPGFSANGNDAINGEIMGAYHLPSLSRALSNLCEWFVHTMDACETAVYKVPSDYIEKQCTPNVCEESCSDILLNLRVDGGDDALPCVVYKSCGRIA